jgi:integrase
LAFSAHLKRPAGALTRAEAVNTLDAIARSGRVGSAGRTLAYARACFAWAEKRGKVAENPFRGLPISSGAAARDRVLTDAEVGLIWRATAALGWPFGPLVRLLLLTAQRRDEVAGMRWSELSPDRAVWTIPKERTKNGRAHVVHLAPEARAVLAGVPRFRDTDLVFSTTGASPVSGFSRAKERLDALCGRLAAEEARADPSVAAMADWRLHDFRRTAVTWLAGAGFAPHAADKLLNHTATTGLSDVARIYQRGEFLSERKAALEAWAKHVSFLAGAEAVQGSNVVPLSAKAVPISGA